MSNKCVLKICYRGFPSFLRSQVKPMNMSLNIVSLLDCIKEHRIAIQKVISSSKYDVF